MAPTPSPGAPAEAERRAARNEALLRERVHADVHAGRAFVRERVGHLFPGVLGHVLSPLARAFYASVGEAAVERRIRRYVDVVVAACRTARAEGLDVAVAAWTPQALELEELAHRGDRSHPRFPEAERLLEAAFRGRVALIHRFLRDGRGDTYPEAVRAAFPDRAEVDAALAEQFALARESVDLVEAAPDLLRFPRAFRPPLYRLVRDAIAWYEARIRHELDAIYA